MRSNGTSLARPRSPSNRAIAWLRWFGPLRVAGAVLGALVLGAAGVWAVRAPVPAADAHDPRGAAIDGSRAATPSPRDVPLVSLVGADPAGEPSVVVVHVAGAVVSPGVHRLGPGDRVVDAVEAAGGPLGDARLDALNLAATVVDGERIYVPVEGEVVVAPDPVEAVPPPIDLNRATSVELERLQGVGPALAAEIVAERERSGPFASVDDLLRVRGIGPVKLGAIRDHAVVS